MRLKDEGQGAADTRLSDEAIDWIVRLHSGLATATDARAFRAWRDQSVAHEAAAQEAETIWSGLGMAGPVHRKRRREQLTRRSVLGGSAVVVAGIACARSGILRGFLSDYSTSSGERRLVTLSDGSSLELNGSSSMSVDISARMRTVTLQEGQATFAVARDESRPFIVRALGGEARVLGTQFDVDMRDNGVFVTVLEGRVEVADARNVRVELGADEQAHYGTNAPLTAIGVNAEQATAWRRGRLVFENRRLDSVIAEIARQGSGQVLILNPDIASLEMSGVFDIRDTDTVIEAIEQTLPVAITRLPFVTIIR